MPYRFTDNSRWSDSWFSKLTNLEKLLYIYLCDNCDVAGFIEVNVGLIAFHLNTTQDEIQKTFEGFSKKILWSKDGDCIYIRKFLKHQCNLPLNLLNKSHVGILRRFEGYLSKFDEFELLKCINYDVYQFYNDFNTIKGGSKGDTSPTSISISKSKKEGGEGGNNADTSVTRSIDTHYELLSTQTTILESIARGNKLKSVDITLAYLNRFHEELKIVGDTVKTEFDYRKHFVNWLKKQPKDNSEILTTTTSKRLKGGFTKLTSPGAK